MKKKWKLKFYIHRHPDDPPFRRLKIKESLTKKKHQKNIARSFKYIIQIIASVFLLGIVFVALFKYVF